MANHKSSIKRIKQTKKRTVNNKIKKSETRSAIKKLRLFIAQNNKEEATKFLPKVQGLLGNLAQKGVIKKNNSSRKTSRLAKQVSSMS